MLQYSKHLAAILLLIFSITACKNKPEVKKITTIQIRINEEPDVISPFFSKTSIAGQLSEKIFLPLAEFDPLTLRLRPVLVGKIPKATYNNGLEQYKLSLRPGIKWQDGRNMTSKDIITTFKLLFNPFSEANSIRSTLKNLVDIVPDATDSLTFDVFFKGRYHLDLEAVINMPIVPAHTYDRNGFIQSVPLAILAQKGDSLLHCTDSAAYQLNATAFKDRFSDFEHLNGSGGYNVKSWKQGQIISLAKIHPWWGDKYADSSTTLQAYAQELNYLVLPDENSAINALKSGHLDILAGISPTKIKELENSPLIRDSFDLGCPDILQYYYIAMNNSNPALGDVNVRKALAGLLDVDKIIAQLMDGKATRVVSPILPRKFYYNKALIPVSFDPSSSQKLLEEGGWKLESGQRVRSKRINGKVIPLQFTYLTTGKQLGKEMTALLQNEAAKIGISIQPEVMEFTQILQKVKAGSYDLANMAASQFPGLDDPYLSWHSSNAFGKGTNVANLQNPLIDSLVAQIRNAPDEATRNKFFKDFQVTMYKLQPVIFLFSPQNCILINKKLHPVFSMRRPGYFENSMQ